MIVNSHQYPTFLEHMIKHFIRILVDGEPYFIAEYHIFVSFEINNMFNNNMSIPTVNLTCIVINVISITYMLMVLYCFNINFKLDQKFLC